MGSIYGAMLHDTGNDVAFLEANTRVVEAITTDGLVITRRDGAVDTYRVPASSDAAALGGPVDLVLFQVKGFATAAAADGAGPLIGPDTAILTLQNGLGNEDTLRAAYPANPVLIGVSVHSVASHGPGALQPHGRAGHASRAIG